jgi:hypothetical protein
LANTTSDRDRRRRDGSLDRRATLVFPPAVLPATPMFATVLAVVKSGPAPEAAGIQEADGDEFPLWSADLDSPTRLSVLEEPLWES